jgi:hypothetical protein
LSDQPAARFEALEGRTLMSLTPVGAPAPLNTPGVFDFQADVAMDADGDSVATWFHVSDDFSDGWPIVRLFDPQGNPKGPEIRVDGAHPSQNNAFVSADDAGNFVVAYVANDMGLYARLYDAAGTPRGPEFRVDDVPGSAGQNGIPYVDLAMSGDGRFAVVWKQTDSAGAALLYARRYTAAGEPADAPFRVDDAASSGSAMDSQLAVNDKGELFAVWRRREAFSGTGAGDVFGRVFSDADVPEGPAFTISSSGDASAPSVAATKNNFIVAWRDSGGVAGGPQSVRAQRFNRHGLAQADPILVDADLPAGGGGLFYGGPWVDAATDGRFAVAWAEPGAGEWWQQGAAYVRQFDAEGLAASGPVQLGAGTVDNFYGLNGFAADDRLEHGLAVWFNNDNWTVTGQFLVDPVAATAMRELGNAGPVATDLLRA